MFHSSPEDEERLTDWFAKRSELYKQQLLQHEKHSPRLKTPVFSFCSLCYASLLAQPSNTPQKDPNVQEQPRIVEMAGKEARPHGVRIR